MPSVNSIVGGGDNPRPLDTEVLAGYNIYRSTAPNVQIIPANLIRSYTLQSVTTYNDSAVVNGTTYYYKVCAVYDNGSGPEIAPPTNEASATPRMGARMVLNPLSYNVTGQVGHVVTQNLNIANPGGLDLTYGIFASSGRVGLNHSRGNGTVDAIHSHRIDHRDKNNLPAEPNNPPMILGSGGPDDFGYQWIDSDEQGGPAYNWIDITGIGEVIPISLDDDNQGPFEIGFDVPYYGNTYSQFYVCSNGWLSFTSTSTAYFNSGLPDPTAPTDLLAPFWDDMDPGDGGTYMYYTDGTQLVVAFIGVMHYMGGGPYTFEAVISANGSIMYNYLDMGSPQDQATIGIQNSDGTIGLQVAYDQAYVHNELAIRFSAGWLSANPSAGTIAPGSNTNASIIFDASTLDVGVYTGSLTVSGEDMNHSVGTVNIPVTFHVEPVGIEDNAENLPKEFDLAQNYPNPFNPTTGITFALPTKAHVTLEVYNVLGQKVKTLVNSDMEAGYKSVTWNGKDEVGASVSSGTYFYMLKAGDKTFTKKMTMLK
jgi:hypothetical protein